MQHYESFGECLKRCLAEEGLSASEAARLVGFSSRNSIFRILSGEASAEIKLRFLRSLHEAIGMQWPEKHWYDLQTALSVERLGQIRYQENKAFERLLYRMEDAIPSYRIHAVESAGTVEPRALSDLLKEVALAPKAEIIITGCCKAGLSRLLADCCEEAGREGRLSIRHYFDTGVSVVTRNILGVLPLVSKPWYNARLVEPSSCPAEMQAIYRLHCIHVQRWDESGNPSWTICVHYDEENFTFQDWHAGLCPAVALLDRWRFQLELLKPLPSAAEGPGVFVEYTKQYAALEENCAIFSVKPDAHFNCIPTYLLEQAVMEGFEQSGIAAGPELVELIGALKQVHEQRYHNMFAKHRPTHLVYSFADMERFMRTGVLTDQFFIQRAYTVEERREIIRVLLDAMRELPYFNVHFLKEGAPPLRYEISYYEGKGVLLMDSYTGYDLDSDHSEALITLPAFAQSVKRFIQDELLPHYVLSRSETIQALEYLLVMNIK
ncbi:MAG: helix-turn-helix transcriptional regulator [Clostridia bacterium]|nr:helix-turn-helix transcriptional regulator [Clostridia bacterium]